MPFWMKNSRTKLTRGPLHLMVCHDHIVRTLAMAHTDQLINVKKLKLERVVKSKSKKRTL